MQKKLVADFHFMEFCFFYGSSPSSDLGAHKKNHEVSNIKKKSIRNVYLSFYSGDLMVKKKPEHLIQNLLFLLGNDIEALPFEKERFSIFQEIDQLSIIHYYYYYK